MSAVQVATEKAGDAVVIRVDGNIDGSSAPEAQSAILPLIQPGCRLILDLSKVEYMSSAGLRMMLMIFRQVSAKSGKVVLLGLSEDIRDTMELTGFLDFFSTAATLETAQAAVKE